MNQKRESNKCYLYFIIYTLDTLIGQIYLFFSFVCSYKWWLASFIFVIIISFVVQRQRIDEENPIKKERLFTVDELQSYTKDELYLAILGRDASRGFHTGGTSAEDLTDDLTGLTDEDIAGVYGKLIGRYFDTNGTPTKHFSNVLISVNNMKKKNEEKARFEQQWPPCNSEWSHDAGKRVWCTEKSGGIERTWIGVPRRYFDSSTKTERCVCVQNSDEQNGRFKQYKDCLPTSTECKILE
ncbi:unnamed protein product [Rotaria sp. Silwood1]|nr:unnamed protein product [Rotaria sp. Silwood1]